MSSSSSSFAHPSSSLPHSVLAVPVLGWWAVLVGGQQPFAAVRRRIDSRSRVSLALVDAANTAFSAAAAAALLVSWRASRPAVYHPLPSLAHWAWLPARIEHWREPVLGRIVRYGALLVCTTGVAQASLGAVFACRSLVAPASRTVANGGGGGGGGDNHNDDDDDERARVVDVTDDNDDDDDDDDDSGSSTTKKAKASRPTTTTTTNDTPSSTTSSSACCTSVELGVAASNSVWAGVSTFAFAHALTLRTKHDAALFVPLFVVASTCAFSSADAVLGAIDGDDVRAGIEQCVQAAVASTPAPVMIANVPFALAVSAATMLAHPLMFPESSPCSWLLSV